LQGPYKLNLQDSIATIIYYYEILGTLHLQETCQSVVQEMWQFNLASLNIS